MTLLHLPPNIKHTLDALLHFFFPSLCAVCGDFLNPQFRIFCDHCLHELSLIEQEGRCPRCFCPKEGDNPCENCAKVSRCIRQQAACFDETLVARRLLSLLKEGIGVEAAAAYVVLQMEKLRWPLPNLVIPTPGDWFDAKEGWNTRKALARDVARILNRRFTTCATLQRYLLPIQYEPLEKQPHRTSENVVLSSPKVVNHIILLIHDTFETGQASVITAHSLQNSGARAVYSMSLIAQAGSAIS